ncbi:MAG: potassium channel family protein [Phormidium sp.]
MLLRKKISFYLEDIETPTGRSINLIITGLVLLSSVIFVIETFSISPDIRTILKYIDSVILLIFALEYLLRFWCVENKYKFLFSLYSVIDLIAILPVFIGWIDISFIRLFRWLRILRLLRFLDPQNLPGHLTTEDSLILTRIIFTLFAIVFVYSGLIYQVEHPVNPEVFQTFFDAAYFAVVTMTTVGFGDVTPISQAGRFLTIMMIFTGIALIPWQVGDLIKRVVKSANEVEIPCHTCGLFLHDPDANFCKICGTKLEKTGED